MESWKKELYLQHHGIKGQKWGVRNGPPYPLGISKHSSSEKKAGWRQSLKNKHGGRHNESHSNNKPKGSYGAAFADKILNSPLRYTPLSSIAVTANSIETVNKALTIKKDKNTGFALRKDHAEETLDSVKSDAKKLNPTGNMINCVLCSMSYDLRRRGFDVGAQPAPYTLDLKGMVDLIYDKTETSFASYRSNNRKSQLKELSEQLKANGNGSRGILAGNYDGTDMGHAIAWHVLNGKVEYIDGQIGEVYSDPYERLFKHWDMKTVKYARLDDKKLTNSKYNLRHIARNL